MCIDMGVIYKGIPIRVMCIDMGLLFKGIHARVVCSARVGTSNMPV